MTKYPRSPRRTQERHGAALELAQPRAATAALVLLLAAVAGSPAPPAAEAQPPVVIRLATLVPDGSSWYLILKETAERWKQVSGGRVTVRLFPGGVAGDDADVVRKMQRGTLSAAVLGAAGLAAIEPSASAIGIPLLCDSYDEAYAVRETLRPALEASFAAKGFVVLNWVNGGFVHFFARRPVAAPDDLRALKLFAGAADAETLAVWRSAGFDPVPLPASELAAALQSGRVEAFPAPPQIAVILQLFDDAKYMTALRWQLLPGATVVSRSVWETLPADVRPKLLEVAREAGARLQQEARDSETRDVAAMKKRGLVVVPVSAAQRVEWQKLAESLYPRIRGTLVPAPAFDEALRQRDAYRKARGAAASR